MKILYTGLRFKLPIMFSDLWYSYGHCIRPDFEMGGFYFRDHIKYNITK